MYIILETFGGADSTFIVTTEEGEVATFHTEKEAMDSEIYEDVQNPRIVKI